MAVPVIESVVALADWLALTPNDLRWFADLRSMTHRPDRQQLGHYRYHVLPKRLIEEPKRTLKLLQRQILRRILTAVPPHPAAHGFTWAVHQDLRRAACGPARRAAYGLARLLSNITRARIQADFRTIGYPKAVACRRYRS
jgi:RNA-directed DNA polymerase